MGWHNGLPSLGTPALTFSRSPPAFFLPLSPGVPISTQHWRLAAADSPRLISLLPLWVAGWEEQKWWPGLFHRTLSCMWRGEGKGHSVRNQNHPTVSTCSLWLWHCSTAPSQIWELPFFRGGKQVVECPKETKLPASHSFVGSLDSISCFTTNCGLRNMQFVTN